MAFENELTKRTNTVERLCWICGLAEQADNGVVVWWDLSEPNSAELQIHVQRLDCGWLGAEDGRTLL